MWLAMMFIWLPPTKSNQLFCAQGAFKKPFQEQVLELKRNISKQLEEPQPPEHATLEQIAMTTTASVVGWLGSTYPRPPKVLEIELCPYAALIGIPVTW
ncbi:unnamed protein product [Cylicostephanus goldi]|uniref:Uncharacterized protein n=1 Tax=Cylicostephanus goldi TaxID=71465 RepID=A0A3P6S2A2_CYLGO|nr:unnamed protein product [Cylicostephanus goldi]